MAYDNFQKKIDDYIEKNNALIRAATDEIMQTVNSTSLVNINTGDIDYILKNRAIAAVCSAQSNDKYDVVDQILSKVLCPIHDVKGVLINILGGPSMTPDNARDVVGIICEKMNDNADIVWSAQAKDELMGKIRINAVFVTGEKGNE